MALPPLWLSGRKLLALLIYYKTEVVNGAISVTSLWQNQQGNSRHRSQKSPFLLNFFIKSRFVKSCMKGWKCLQPLKSLCSSRWRNMSCCYLLFFYNNNQSQFLQLFYSSNQAFYKWHYRWTKCLIKLNQFIHLSSH